MENNIYKILSFMNECEEDGYEFIELLTFCINENILETFEKFQNSLIKIYEEQKKTSH